MPDHDDAVFREALDEFEEAVFTADIDNPNSGWVGASRARVLALYAEASRGMTPEESAQYKAFLRSRFTPAERQGEVYEVEKDSWGCPCVDLPPHRYSIGNRVRIIRVEAP